MAEIYLYEDPYYLGDFCLVCSCSRSDSDYNELSKVWNFAVRYHL